MKKCENVLGISPCITHDQQEPSKWKCDKYVEAMHEAYHDMLLKDHKECPDLCTLKNADPSRFCKFCKEEET